jgi:hypothetical protein
MLLMRPEIQRLLKQADRDLENARKSVTIEASTAAGAAPDGSTPSCPKAAKNSWAMGP